MFETDAYSDHYLEAQVMTAAPHRLHLMVIDGALRYARQAAQALEAADYEAAHAALNSSRDFVSELIAGLKPECAPEMVEPIKRLFVFVYHSLATADLERDAARVRDAIRILELHRETWLELAQRIQQAEPQAEAIRDGASAETAGEFSDRPAPPHFDADASQRSWTV